MKAKISILLLFISYLLLSCGHPEKTSKYENPSAEGFDLAHSDPAAVELADSVMSAMGGRRNWDKTRFISWNSGDGRNLSWDKELDRVRIESLEDSTIYLLDTKTLEGRAQIKGEEITIPDSLNKMLGKARSIWINDSYWLVMPFKLKDKGVTLKYLGEDTLKTGGRCNVLELTFSNVGDTPQNKYQVFIDLKDNLIKQWAYYNEVSKDTANWVRPWDNYQTYNNILLSADRSDNRGPKNVKVSDMLDDKIFMEF